MPTLRRTAYCRHRRNQLLCEPLEERAMLAGMIATVELPPQSASTIAVETQAFIESALNNALVAHAYDPLGATVTTEQGQNEAGRPAKITKLTVSLADGSSDLANDNRASLIADPAPQAIGNSLEFTFYVYPDNSMSLRARLLSQVDVGISGATTSVAVPSIGELSAQVEAAGWRDDGETPSPSKHPEGEHSDAVTCPTGQADRNPSVPSGGQPQQVYGPLPDRSSGGATNDANSGGVQDVIGGSATEGMLLLDGDRDSELGDTSDKSWKASECDYQPTPVSNDAGLQGADTELTPPALPIPSDMVAIDYQSSSRTTNNAVASSSAPESAALFQVFIRAPAANEVTQVTATARGLPAKPWAASTSSQVARESHPIRYASVAAVSLACGYWLTTHVAHATAGSGGDGQLAQATRAAANEGGASQRLTQPSTAATTTSHSSAGFVQLPTGGNLPSSAAYAAASQLARRVGALFKRRAYS